MAFAGVRRLAIVPAYNEERSVAAVVREIRAADPDMAVAVVDDGSGDDTAVEARLAGATVLRLPFNLGIGGAVQTGFVYALEAGYDVAVQVDGDGQHDARDLRRLLLPVVERRADVAIGSRFVGSDGYRVDRARRVAMRVWARMISLVIGQRISDVSSSFRVLNRRAIAFCAAEYPQGFLETIEITATLARHGFRLVEVPVSMRVRSTGRSSLGLVLTCAYSAKVLVALFVGIFRPVPKEES